MNYTKKILSVGVIALIIAGMFAGKASALSVDDLLARIAELTAQVDGLMKQFASAKEGVSSDTFLINLKAGIRNNGDVRRLQQFLIAQGYLKKGYGTGNFLSMTVGAVKQFQSAMGLPVTGIFDKQTRDKVNELVKAAGNAAITAAPAAGGEKTILIKTATTTALAVQATTALEAPTSSERTAETYHVDTRPTYDVLAIERATFDAVNAERQKNGLDPVMWSDQLADVARAHSNDQAGDNVKITDPDVACLYPYIRHEGFVAGFKVGDRLDNKNIPYVVAGENIIIFPMTKELIYRSAQEAPACKKFSDGEGPAGETQDAARIRIQNALLDRSAAMIGQQKLDWVNKQWKGVGELASEATMDWMNSPGHRRNILTPEFKEGAIGASIVNDYIIMTEVFLERP